MTYDAQYQRLYRETHKEQMTAYRLNNKKRISLQRKEYRERTQEIKIKEPGTMTRREAIESGLGRYFTGKRCINGHLSERTINNGCCECFEERKLRGEYKGKSRG